MTDLNTADREQAKIEIVDQMEIESAGSNKKARPYHEKQHSIKMSQRAFNFSEEADTFTRQGEEVMSHEATHDIPKMPTFHPSNYNSRQINRATTGDFKNDERD